MLDGVALGRVHDRLLVGRGQAQIKGGDGGAGRRIAVDAAHIHAGLEQQMVNGKNSRYAPWQFLSVVNLGRGSFSWFE